MTDVRDHLDNTQPRPVNGKLSSPRGTYLRLTAPRHGPTHARPSAAALTPSPAMRARRAFRTIDVVPRLAAAPQVAATDDQPEGSQ